jgi:hypothetical protein
MFNVAAADGDAHRAKKLKVARRASRLFVAKGEL